MSRSEVEDGMGFSGLVSDATEDRCWKELGERNGQLLDAKAEIERLRAALDHVKSVCDDNANVPLQGRAMALQFVRDVAANALNVGPSTKE